MNDASFAGSVADHESGTASREVSGMEELPIELSRRGEPSRGSNPSNAAATCEASAEARAVGRLSKTRHAPQQSTRFHGVL